VIRSAVITRLAAVGATTARLVVVLRPRRRQINAGSNRGTRVVALPASQIACGVAGFASNSTRRSQDWNGPRVCGSDSYSRSRGTQSSWASGSDAFGLEQEFKPGHIRLERNIAQSDAKSAKFPGPRNRLSISLSQVVFVPRMAEYNAAYEAAGISVEIKRPCTRSRSVCGRDMANVGGRSQDVIRLRSSKRPPRAMVILRPRRTEEGRRGEANALIGPSVRGALAATNSFRSSQGCPA